jgi:hypothetical protein
MQACGVAAGPHTGAGAPREGPAPGAACGFGLAARSWRPRATPCAAAGAAPWAAPCARAARRAVPRAAALGGRAPDFSGDAAAAPPGGQRQQRSQRAAPGGGQQAPWRGQQQRQHRARGDQRGRERVPLFTGGALPGEQPARGGGGRGAATSAAAAPSADPTAALLTRQITAAPDWPTLAAVLQDRVAGLNAVHVSAALHQLSRIVGPRGAGALPAGERRQVALVVEALLERGEDVAE